MEYRPSGCTLPRILNTKKHKSSQQTNEPTICKQLEDRLTRSQAIIAEMQRQLVLGEEAYFDETGHYGNIYRGWEGYAFADSKLSSSSSNPSLSTNKRRMPKEDRWFSQSCVHVEPATAPFSGIQNTSTCISNKRSRSASTQSNKVKQKQEEDVADPVISSTTSAVATVKTTTSLAAPVHVQSSSSVSTLQQRQTTQKSTARSVPALGLFPMPPGTMFAPAPIPSSKSSTKK